MRRRMIGLLLPILMAGVVMVGLQFLADTEAAAALDKPVTILYWHPYSGDRGALMARFVAEFNASNPYSITVVAEYAGGYDDIYQQVIRGLQGDGPLPNLAVAYPNSFADFARYGQVRFLDDYLADPVLGITDTADFYPNVLDYYRLVVA